MDVRFCQIIEPNVAMCWLSASRSRWVPPVSTACAFRPLGSTARGLSHPWGDPDDSEALSHPASADLDPGALPGLPPGRLLPWGHPSAVRRPAGRVAPDEGQATGCSRSRRSGCEGTRASRGRGHRHPAGLHEAIDSRLTPHLISPSDRPLTSPGAGRMTAPREQVPGSSANVRDFRGDRAGSCRLDGTSIARVKGG
jgi:hypothetical protein